MARRDDDDYESRLLGNEMVRNFWTLMERDALSDSELAYMRGMFCVDSDKQKELIRKHREWKRNGMDDLTFFDGFRETMEQQFNQLLRGLDPLTRAGAYASKRDKWFVPFGIFDRAWWTSWMEAGNDGYVTGVKGSGKTDFMCLLAEIFMESGGTVVSCVPFKEEVNRYIYCTQGTQLLRTSCELMLEGIPCLVLTDEAFLHSSGETPLKPRTMWFRQFGRLFRKLGISHLTASQRYSDILRETRQSAVFRAKKLYRERPHMAFVDMKGKVGNRTEEFTHFVKWIPKTTLPYLTEAIGSFVMDFDPSKLQDYLASLPMEDNQYEACLKWLEGQGFEFSPEQKVYLSKKMAEVGIYQSKIAAIFGVSQATISRWLRM
jgi:hypothetical protein